MFEQTFKNIDNILNKDSDCGNELDYVEQTSWLLFLKYLDDLRDFVDQKLFPYLRNFKENTSNTNIVEYKIEEIL